MHKPKDYNFGDKAKKHCHNLNNHEVLAYDNDGQHKSAEEVVRWLQNDELSLFQVKVYKKLTPSIFHLESF